MNVVPSSSIREMVHFFVVEEILHRHATHTHCILRRTEKETPPTLAEKIPHITILHSVIFWISNFKIFSRDSEFRIGRFVTPARNSTEQAHQDRKSNLTFNTVTRN